MKKMYTEYTVVVALLFLACNAFAQQTSPIMVLLVRAPGISPTQALSILPEIEALTENSDLGVDYKFENAGDHLGAPDLVIPSSCSGTDPDALPWCAFYQHRDERDIYDADIVVLVVPSINAATCGAIIKKFINWPIISSINHVFGYAVVSASCNWNGWVNSHEVLHLLSIEHKNGDQKLSTPERDNHGWVSGENGTAGSSPGDCPGGQCTYVENKMSDPDDTFTLVPQALGDNTHANARSVVSEKSWHAVAAYRPKGGGLPPDECIIEVTPSCGSPYTSQISAYLPGYSVSNVDIDFRLDGASIWNDLYEGILSCPSLQQVNQAIIRAVVESSSGISYCEAPYYPVYQPSNCESGGFN